jgi:hypothetical protein
MTDRRQLPDGTDDLERTIGPESAGVTIRCASSTTMTPIEAPSVVVESSSRRTRDAMATVGLARN